VAEQRQQELSAVRLQFSVQLPRGMSTGSNRNSLPVFLFCQSENANILKPDGHQNNKASVRTSQETHYVSATKPNRLMLFREIIAVYCENHMEHTNILCVQNAEFLYNTAGGTYSYDCALKD
jgi:hypothetical protein